MVRKCASIKDLSRQGPPNKRQSMNAIHGQLGLSPSFVDFSSFDFIKWGSHWDVERHEAGSKDFGVISFWRWRTHDGVLCVKRVLILLIFRGNIVQHDFGFDIQWMVFDTYGVMTLIINLPFSCINKIELHSRDVFPNTSLDWMNNRILFMLFWYYNIGSIDRGTFPGLKLRRMNFYFLQSKYRGFCKCQHANTQYIYSYFVQLCLYQV